MREVHNLYQLITFLFYITFYMNTIVISHIFLFNKSKSLIHALFSWGGGRPQCGGGPQCQCLTPPTLSLQAAWGASPAVRGFSCSQGCLVHITLKKTNGTLEPYLMQQLTTLVQQPQQQFLFLPQGGATIQENAPPIVACQVEWHNHVYG